jgi:hypothetical protein
MAAILDEWRFTMDDDDGWQMPGIKIEIVESTDTYPKKLTHQLQNVSSKHH